MSWLKLAEITALFCTGLLAGVFFAFEAAVNPALHRLSDAAYLSAMQQINRVIQNPAFFAVFILPVLLLPFLAWQNGSKIWSMAALIYIAAVFGVTAFFNVPLNELLDKFDLNNTAPGDLKAMRTRYEMPWNRWHTIRTLAAVVAYGLAILTRHGINLSAKSITPGY